MTCKKKKTVYREQFKITLASQFPEGQLLEYEKYFGVLN